MHLALEVTSLGRLLLRRLQHLSLFGVFSKHESVKQLFQYPRVRYVVISCICPSQLYAVCLNSYRTMSPGAASTHLSVYPLDHCRRILTVILVVVVIVHRVSLYALPAPLDNP